MDKKNLLEYLLPGASIDFLKKTQEGIRFCLQTTDVQVPENQTAHIMLKIKGYFD